MSRTLLPLLRSAVTPGLSSPAVVTSVRPANATARASNDWISEAIGLLAMRAC